MHSERRYNGLYPVGHHVGGACFYNLLFDLSFQSLSFCYFVSRSGLSFVHLTFFRSSSSHVDFPGLRLFAPIS